MKNIIYNTTRQWNCGDEFILRGCINIMESVVGPHNPIIYNRNPDVRPANGSEIFYRNEKLPLNYEDGNQKKLGALYRYGFNDNSVKFNSDLSFVDYAVFAGSPEWTSSRCDNFYYHIIKNQIPAIFLGIGSKYNTDIPLFMSEVIKKNVFFSFRSEELLSDSFDCCYLPCPALLAVKIGQERKIKSVNSIGLVFQSNYEKSVRCQCISDETYKYQIKLYNSILNHFSEKKIYIFVHYIDELNDAIKIFKNQNCEVLYSYDSKDYVDIYRRVDFVISTRVHGCGISSSLGIPNFVIAHDDRADTTKGFLSHVIEVNSNIDEVIKRIEVEFAIVDSLNEKIIENKKRVFIQYKRSLVKVINKKADYGKNFINKTAQFNRVLELDKNGFSEENRHFTEIINQYKEGYKKYFMYRVLTKLHSLFTKAKSKF